MTPDDLMAAAAIVEADLPAVAAELRRLAARPEVPAPIRFRCMVLQRIWRQHFYGMTKTAVANLIAPAWREWKPRGEELPDTLEAAFARLHAGGVRPVSARQIIEDLDSPVD